MLAAVNVEIVLIERQNAEKKLDFHFDRISVIR